MPRLPPYPPKWHRCLQSSSFSFNSIQSDASMMKTWLLAHTGNSSLLTELSKMLKCSIFLLEILKMSQEFNEERRGSKRWIGEAVRIISLHLAANSKHQELVVLLGCFENILNFIKLQESINTNCRDFTVWYPWLLFSVTICIPCLEQKSDKMFLDLYLCCFGHYEYQVDDWNFKEVHQSHLSHQRKEDQKLFSKWKTWLKVV